jgi:AraC-like DNA-binding protein
MDSLYSFYEHFKKEMGIGVRDYKRLQNCKRLEDFIARETPNKYYVLGALYSSCRYNYRHGSYYLIFRTSKKDLAEIVKQELGVEKAIVKNKPNANSYFFQVPITRELLQKLHGLGLIEKDQRKFPKIKEKYLSHFVRGFIDAKGNFYKKKKTLELKIFSSYNTKFLQGLYDVLVKYAGIKAKKKKYGLGHGLLIFCSPKSITKIRDFIYSELGSSYCLPSVKKIFYSIEESFSPSSEERIERNIEKAKELLKKGVKCTNLGKELHTHLPSLYEHFKQRVGMTPGQYQKQLKQNGPF